MAGTVHLQSSGLSPLVDLVRCLECGAALVTDELQSGGDGIAETVGVLRCEICARSYPVTDGTVRMVETDAGSTAEAELKARTADSFAYEWEHFGALRDEWTKNFRAYLQPHDPAWLQDKLVLDVGTGSGRHSRQAHEAGARVVAVDIGASIDTARRNLPPGVLTVQADAERLPFAPGSFDMVMSIGVLHHLPDTERAFHRLVPLAREGGIVHVYLYWLPPRRSHRRILRLVDLARRVTTRLPHRILHPFCYPIAAALFGCFVLPYRLLRDKPRLAGFAEAFPLKAYADYPFAVCVNDQFDRFSAPLERRFTEAEVRRLFVSAGLDDVTVLPNNGWVASGRRPKAP